MLRLCGPSAEKPKVLKSWFLPQKSPVHAAKNAENGAFLAHPEPEILLIEVAYFLAATEYTFSAHCSFNFHHNNKVFTSMMDILEIIFIRTIMTPVFKTIMTLVIQTFMT
jgi:hypothetical protein